jgi:TonB family protein
VTIASIESSRRRPVALSRPRRDPGPIVLKYAVLVAVACVIVFLLLVGSLYMFGAYDKEDGPRSQRVELLAELYGETRKPERPRLPELADIPPLELPKRPQSGFVQIEVVVDEQGRVAEAEVVGATHEGVFEEQALAIVKARRYEPRPEVGVDRRLEIVDYTIAEDEGD